MSVPLLYSLPGNEAMTELLAKRLGADTGTLETREFPDGETYLRFATAPAGESVALVCALGHPNDKFLPLLLAAATARDLGAKTVGLIAPYLAYMRQDRRFHEGEAITSRYVAKLISGTFDWLVTVDPHLHRYRSLSDIYAIPTRVVHAAPLLSGWIKTHVKNAIVIGPDSESEQWVSAVAADAGASYTVLEKIRVGDRDVRIQAKDVSRLQGRQPVFVDDIISSGRTMLEAIRVLQSEHPICIAIHGLFADRSDKLLPNAGAMLVTSNTIPHETNAIDVSGPLSEAVVDLLQTSHGHED